MMTSVDTNDLVVLVLPEFPEDVVLEILLRLPVKSILRFKCVSKSWYSFLNTPHFIAKHLSLQSNDHLFIITRCEKTKHSIAYSISDIDDVSTYTELDMLSPYLNHEDVIGDHRAWRIAGPCDGLIVIADYIGGDAIICNIATRNFRTLPKSYFFPFPKKDFQELILDQYGQECHAYISYAGLGYDRKHNDYKVLRVLEFWEDVYREVELPPRAEVFSIGVDTCWREINMTNVPKFSNFNCRGTYFDGSLYLMTNDDSVLLSFNIVDERFRNIPLPGGTAARNDDDVLFSAVYSNKLALVDLKRFYSLDSDISMDVWVMKEFRMEQSWTKLLTIRPITRMYAPTTFGKNDTELFYDDINGQLRVYDLVKMETKIISFKDEVDCSDVAPYTKTLVCINRRM